MRIVKRLSRRRFVSSLVGAAPVLALPRALWAVPATARVLNFVHTHTGERLSVEYFHSGDYLPDALTTRAFWTCSIT